MARVPVEVQPPSPAQKLAELFEYVGLPPPDSLKNGTFHPADDWARSLPNPNPANRSK